ncbi:ino80 chromatin remodeling complex protein [Colletotrichum karsti]|uniref:Ino80 chromatin remodeling complex protein n=1 Tax=Colletotrichum karsti TaxID=1095194 RepID=A0A9P6I379_9PEZI|nr:ino80 chromatin remodeling complex protein [Colletotrichum karsti]KAF9876102.1 ino80 chromatin remodeling complex protein [Colletotrichum karsti]
MSSSTAGPDERRSAKNLVKDIAKEHGYIGEEILLGIPEDRRRMIEDALLKKDQMIGSSVITLAKNLYSSKARFVFELLQNADDNQYTKAAAEGSVPFVRFTVFPRKIVLECNEDGFTPQNLTAICSIGKSSKTGAHGYIGEKGIGFKSVFMVAWKVHIQSGPFSFSFRHKNGDSGMGMISPVWEDIEEELESPLTRITLHLHETGDKGAIRAQFEELQETVLMFLRNIRKVVVRFYDQDGQQLSSVTHTLTYPQEHRARLQRVEVVNGKSEEQITHFHITRHDADGLSRNESRTYSDAEEASRAYEKSEIVLAFPLSHSSAPIIEPQDVFAFLPVRKVGFNFLIQADFVTTANRQDIVGDSSRNLSLIPEIANAFIIAASQFCEYATLRYEWLKYLPDRQDNSRAKIWDDLVDAISGNLIDAKVFYDNKSLALRDLSDLYRPEEAHFDEYGELLLDDGSPGQVISRHYSKVALDTLDDYESLTSIGLPQVSRWLEADLRDSASSRMKSPETTKDWHERTARLLNSALAYSLLLYGRSRNEISELKAMDLIPLQDGSWVSAAPPANIYFSQVRGLNIPSTLGLRLVSRKVVSPQRLKLFKSLGVKTASISRVRKTIVNDYDPDDDVMGHLTTETSRDHLEFLYLTENLTDEKLSYPDILVCDDVGLLCHPQHAYFNNHDTEVLKSTPPGPNPGDGAPGYFFKAFLDNAYFDDQPDTPDNQTMTWYEWFSKRLKVMTNVKLPSRDGILPMDLKYVHEYRPEKFLSCLVEGYAASHGLEDLTLEGIGRLRGTDVLCVGNHLRPLEDTYFPARPLKSLLARYVDEDTVFPWLWLDSEEIYETPPPNWKRFLSRLGVGLCEDHLKFALDMLEYSVGALSQDPVASARLFALYQYVQTQYQGSDNRVEAADKIRDVFLTQKCIYIPLQDGKCKWVLPDECVWSAPFDMEGKFALERLYEPWLSVDHVTSSVCMNLFKTTIGVEDCNWSILVDELRTLKRMGCDDIDRIRNIYQALDDLTSTLLSVDMEELRNSHSYISGEISPRTQIATPCESNNMASEAAKLAILIDADNVRPSVAGPLLAEVAKYGTAFVRRAYGDWTGTSLKGWKDQLLTQSIQPVQQFAYTQGKNATDSAMIIDAMDLLYTKRFDGFCLVSSDSDFTRLASRIRESGLVVYGFGEHKTPKPFVSACDKFIYFENIIHDEQIAVPPVSPVVSSPPPQERPQSTLVKSDYGLKNLLRKAVEATSDEDGWANLAKVGALITKRHPDFDPRTFGYLKLGDLVTDTDLFDIDRRRPGEGKAIVMYARDKRSKRVNEPWRPTQLI